MRTYSENENISLPLAARVGAYRVGAAEDVDAFHQDGDFAIPQDRTSPGLSGLVVGVVAGAAALGLVHLLVPAALAPILGRAAEARGLAPAVGLGIGYATACAAGGLLGAAFAVVTRYLRKWFPLLIWGVVFFTSLSMLVLASASAYGRSVAPALAGPILAASALFGAILSFSLPIRRRR